MKRDPDVLPQNERGNDHQQQQCGCDGNQCPIEDQEVDQCRLASKLDLLRTESVIVSALYSLPTHVETVSGRFTQSWVAGTTPLPLAKSAIPNCIDTRCYAPIIHALLGEDQRITTGLCAVCRYPAPYTMQVIA